MAETERSIADLTAILRQDAEELRRIDRQIESLRGIKRTGRIPRRRPGNPNRRLVVDKALELIDAVGKPIPRKNLYRMLSERGVSIQGKDPEMVLGTMLYRDERIVRLKKFGYWFKNRMYEPAFYIPADGERLGLRPQPPSS